MIEYLPLVTVVGAMIYIILDDIYIELKRM